MNYLVDGQRAVILVVINWKVKNVSWAITLPYDAKVQFSFEQLLCVLICHY